MCTSFDATVPKEPSVAYSCLVLLSVYVIIVEQFSLPYTGQCTVGQIAEFLLDAESINLPSYNRTPMQIILRFLHSIIDLFIYFIDFYILYSLFLVSVSINIFQIFAI